MSKTAAFGPIPGATLTTGDNKPSKKPGYGRYGDWSKEDAIEAIRGKHKEISKPGFFRKLLVGDLNEDRQIEELKKYAESNNVRCKKGEMDKIIEEMVRNPTEKKAMLVYASLVDDYISKAEFSDVKVEGHTFKVRMVSDGEWVVDVNVAGPIFPVKRIIVRGTKEKLNEKLKEMSDWIKKKKTKLAY